MNPFAKCSCLQRNTIILLLKYSNFHQMIAFIFFALSYLSTYYFSQAWIYLLGCGAVSVCLPTFYFIKIQVFLILQLLSNIIGFGQQLPAQPNILHLRLESIKAEVQQRLITYQLTLKWTLLSFLTTYHSILQEMILLNIDGFNKILQDPSIATLITKIKNFYKINEQCICQQRYLRSAVAQVSKMLTKSIRGIKSKQNAYALTIQLRNFSIHYSIYSKHLFHNQKKLQESYKRLRQDLLCKVWSFGIIIPGLYIYLKTQFLIQEKVSLQSQYHDVETESRKMIKILKNISHGLECQSINPSIYLLTTQPYQNLLKRLNEVNDQHKSLRQINNK